MPPRIVAIVVTWNRRADLVRCLASLQASDYDNFEVVVVDNGSNDGSRAAVRQAFPRINYLSSANNLGFAGGNNLGIRCGLERGADYVFLLNDDAVVEPSTLGALAQAAEAQPAAGMWGAKIYALEDRRVVISGGGVLQGGWRPMHRSQGARDDSAPGGSAEDRPIAVDFLSGAALLASRKAIEAVGLLDEDFYLYFEDVEWCYRARQRGFSVLAVPQAVVYHPDTRARDPDSPSVTYYSARNSLLFAKKHRLGYAVAARMWLGHLRSLASWSLRPRWRRKRRQRDALAKALRDFVRGRWGAAPSL